VAEAQVSFDTVAIGSPGIKDPIPPSTRTCSSDGKRACVQLRLCVPVTSNYLQLIPNRARNRESYQRSFEGDETWNARTPYTTGDRSCVFK
jgi:hypothetical protein